MSSISAREWEIDYEEVIKQSNNQSFWFCCLCGGPAVFLSPLPILMTPFYFCCTKPIVRKQVESQKLTTTDSDIVYEMGPMWGRPGAAWMACKIPQCWSGKITKTVPFDRVQDVIVVERGGKYCCCYNTEVDFIGIQTASGGAGKNGQPVYEVAVLGVKDAHGFRDHVLGTKRANKGVVTAQPTAGGGSAEKLRQLKALRDDGLITNSEFEEKRKKIMLEI